jgi:hypothetical protein
MSTKKLRKLNDITLEDVKKILKARGLTYKENATTRSSYVSGDKCDIVLDKYPSVGIRETEDGKVEVLGDFYCVNDIFDRRIENHTEPDEFYSSLQQGAHWVQYMEKMEQMGAEVEDEKMKLNERGELVINAQIPYNG